ncbi:hypothetical protein U6A24_14675 [Aquimarina gracilis]|uniref:Uncharacterized protein n=1 Tax=Aquimarina gracilis TaxID=874422 RepID=A0ABU5ZXU0_9FLAO|nr:hypothetical protein [Aquimarina gracilis]MEB3346720.1 hypothetical protein [Aquimarina gracilis]
MRTSKILTTVLCLGYATVALAQSDEVNSKENSSKETVTKIIRIKGANGEEKVIKKQEVITKKSKIELNPGDEDKTNQSATYTDAEVQVQKSHSSTAGDSYTLISDGKGYRITFLSKSGNKTSKARPVSSGYYIVNLGEKDNCLGHFDKEKNFVLERYDSKTDKVITTVYKAN